MYVVGGVCTIAVAYWHSSVAGSPRVCDWVLSRCVEARETEAELTRNEQPDDEAKVRNGETSGTNNRFRLCTELYD